MNIDSIPLQDTKFDDVLKIIFKTTGINRRDIMYLYSLFFSTMEIMSHHHNLDDPEPINPEATEEEKLQHYAESLS